MRLRSLWFVLAVLIAAIPAFAQKKSAAKSGPSMPAAVKRGFAEFDEKAIRADVRFLASDLLEGRGPGTRGDEVAMQYIAAQFEAAGLEPAGDNGSYLQKVPLLGITTDPAKTSLSFTKDGAAVIGPLKHEDEYVGQDQSQVASDKIDSDVIFVGHGVEAPEYRWDDYKGVDTNGKTLIMLVDDPPATESEPDLFKGKARTYYGRWTYKYEMGTAKGAAAVILIHTNDAAGYGWPVVRNSWGYENSFPRLKAGAPALKWAGWVTQDVAKNLFKAAGYDLDQLTKAAGSRDFRPVSLNLKFNASITSNLRPFDTANVVGKVAGSDPKLRDEAVVYTSHHDHLGIGKADDRGDKIYNGAVDNATGCGVLMDLARVWAKTSPAPKRSIYFAAVAAEEQGLLGSAYFGDHPPIPAGRIALDLNYDAIMELGRVSTVQVNGAERTTFYPTVERVAKDFGRKIVPDQHPEQGSYYRSDHFSLGRVGIPAFTIGAGQDVIGKPGAGEKKWEEYRVKHYHQPSDEIEADWDWATSVEMAQFGYWLGWEAANAAAAPNWKPGDEFRAARDKSLGAVK